MYLFWNPRHSVVKAEFLLCCVCMGLCKFNSRFKKLALFLLRNTQYLKIRSFCLLFLLPQPPSSKKTDGSGSHTKSQNTQVRAMSEKKQRKKADSESKQEKANRIISEAIAKAKERGERNIPRVMSPENFPSVSAEGKEEKKGRKVKSKPKDKESKKPKTGSSSKTKEKTKIG